LNPLLRPRPWFLFVAVACAGMLAYALYLQHALFIDPCPLCVFQRLAFIWIGTVALVAAIHNPGGIGRLVYGALLVTGAAAGISVATRHLWLQSLPADQVPDCGMGLNYMLDTLPVTQVLAEVFRGSGECAEVDWTFLGLSMPGWTFLWYLAFAAGTILVLLKAKAARD
jgi:disulfide bond formation protein DsbB